MSRPRVARRRAAAALLAAALAAGLTTACSDDPNSIAAQAKAGDQKNYISGDGTIEKVAADQRGAALTLSGTTLDGQTWKLADERGRIVVLNLWGSWCPPCVEEQPLLSASWSQVQASHKDVQFMGLNTRDSAATALAFVRSNKVTYPSLRDDGQAILALQGKAPSPPTTLFIDRKGRIAARILGAVNGQKTITTMVDELAKEAA